MINQILELGADDELAQATKTLNKVLDEIMLSPPGPKRWRAVVDVLHKTNPIAGEDNQGRPLHFREVNQDCVKVNAALRASASDRYGRSADNIKSNFRSYLSMPRVVHSTIELVDPAAFRLNKNARRMFNTFPEYRQSEAY